MTLIVTQPKLEYKSLYSSSDDPNLIKLSPPEEGTVIFRVLRFNNCISFAVILRFSITTKGSLTPWPQRCL